MMGMVGAYIADHAHHGVEQLARGLLETVAGIGRDNQDNCTVVLAAPDGAALASRWTRSLAKGAGLLNGIARYLTPRDRTGG